MYINIHITLYSSENLVKIRCACWVNKIHFNSISKFISYIFPLLYILCVFHSSVRTCNPLTLIFPSLQHSARFKHLQPLALAGHNTVLLEQTFKMQCSEALPKPHFLWSKDLELSILASKNNIISFSYVPAKCVVLNCIRLFETPWTVAHQSPLSLGFSRKNTGAVITPDSLPLHHPHVSGKIGHKTAAFTHRIHLCFASVLWMRACLLRTIWAQLFQKISDLPNRKEWMYRSTSPKCLSGYP